MKNLNIKDILAVTEIDLSTKENRLLIMASNSRKGLDKASKALGKAKDLNIDVMRSYANHAVDKLKYRPTYFVCPVSNPTVNKNPKVYNDTYAALAVNYCTTNKGTLNEKLWGDYLYSKANAGNTLPKDCKGNTKIAKANKAIHKARKARAKAVTNDIGRDMGNIRRGICGKLQLEVITQVNDWKETALPQKSNKLDKAIKDTAPKNDTERCEGSLNELQTKVQNATNLKKKVEILVLLQKVRALFR